MSITDMVDNIWTPRVITGGKDGTERSTDWLWELELGTIFFCKSKKQGIILHLYQITAKLEQNGKRMMRLENPENPEQYIPVDTRDFSNEYSFHMTLPGVTNGDPVDEERLVGPTST